ncbi:hypothetical protein PIB30_044758 [Stylosanthes scabra]|uniref:Uncharacterized protein n=1 Tax=Stylosanthes scabra TaxID=79078 RepID=A0ABU6QG56_9FABA|nr:hypothetical protein [Stylosanthes scabra]
MVREFCGNFLADHQTHVFLWGRRIPFSEDDIRRYLGITIDLPPLGEDDMFKATVANRKWGELDMDLVFQQHGTTFDLDHAILIYVLMTEGFVNLPRIMRDVPEFPRDEIYHVREQDMYCPYGDWKGELPKVRRGRLISPLEAPPAPQEEQLPPSPPPQPAASEIPSSSVRGAFASGSHEIPAPTGASSAEHAFHAPGCIPGYDSAKF